VGHTAWPATEPGVPDDPGDVAELTGGVAAVSEDEPEQPALPAVKQMPAASNAVPRPMA
jgi:hypothetical protein